MSPLLFIMVLEPQPAMITADGKIKGVYGGGKEHKLLLYADDILLLSGDPLNSILVIMDIIQQYSKLSGYKVNWSKSEAMPISKVCHPAVVKNCSFRWLQKGMTYLGIKLSGNVEEIIDLNFEPLLQKIKSNLEKSVFMGES